MEVKTNFLIGINWLSRNRLNADCTYRTLLWLPRSPRNNFSLCSDSALFLLPASPSPLLSVEVHQIWWNGQSLHKNVWKHLLQRKTPPLRPFLDWDNTNLEKNWNTRDGIQQISILLDMRLRKTYLRITFLCVLSLTWDIVGCCINIIYYILY